MEKIYIFGHKKPDTDSVTSAIALSHLKNEQGHNTEARILGTPNNETKYALSKFNVKEPKYLNDTKLKIHDLDYLKDCSMHEKDTIYSSFIFMNEYNVGCVPIHNDNKKLTGIIALKDIAKAQIKEDIDKLRTSYDNIIKTLNAKEILRFNDEIEGKVITTSYSSSTFIENSNLDENTILIVGDRLSIIQFAISKKVKLIILTKNSKLDDFVIDYAKQHKVNIIISNESAFNTTRKIWLSNYIENYVLTDVVHIHDNESLDDFRIVVKEAKYTNYPVVNNNDEAIGLIRANDINYTNRKKIILVDHNELTQSVDGIDDADIIEIVDHHKIGKLDTRLPISFRNMPVGSTNTIISLMYKESNIDIPSNIAGLMLSGILSDTLMFKSPTTTDVDIDVANELAKIANVNIDEYGIELLKIGSSLKGKTKEEILYTDFKNFSIDNKKIGIGQIFSLNPNEVLKEKDEYIKLIDKVCEENDYYIVSLFVTDIIDNGSYILFNTKSKDIFSLVLNNKELEQGYFIKDCLSRKKQIIPDLISIIEKK